MAGGTSIIKQTGFMVLRKDPDDYTAVDASGGSTTSTSFVDVLTLTFTPSGTFSYLIMACAALGVSSTARRGQVQLLDNNTATAYGLASAYALDTTTNNVFVPWCTQVNLSSLSGSQTFKIQILAETLNTVTYKFLRILALNLNSFPNQYYAESRTQTATTSQSYVDKATLTQTTADYDHYEIGTAIGGNLVSGNTGLQRVEWDFNTNVAGEIVSTTSASADKISLLTVRKRYPGSGSNTWRVQHRSSAGASTNIKDAAVQIIQGNNASSVYIKGKTLIKGKTRIK